MFAERIGVAKRDSTVEIEVLDACIREDLNKRAPRVMAVLHPLKVVIDNYPETLVEEFETVNNPEDPSMGTRKVPFSKVVYIEREDFEENPPKGYIRLTPTGEVRLKGAYFIRHQSTIKDDNGAITELHCTYDPDTRGGDAKDGRKVKGTIHFVSAAHAVEAEVRLYDHLFDTPNPGDDSDGRDFKQKINQQSLTVLKGCKLEQGIGLGGQFGRFQFMRHGYFALDAIDTHAGAPVFNRIVSLKDTWKKK